MTTPSLPYFFDEATLAANAKEPGAREKALNFSTDDLNWLQTVYLPTQAARTAHSKPMNVYRLLLTRPAAADITLAGAIAMSHPVSAKVTLYTPWKGLSNFTDMDAMKNALKAWLAQDTGKQQLLRFLSVEQRHALPDSPVPDISTEAIEGGVFEDQELRLKQNQAQNVKTMMAELLKMPTLQSMLDEALKIELIEPFPTLDQRLTRLVNQVITPSVADSIEARHTRSSLSLSEALLYFYLHNQWPASDARVFTYPGRNVSSEADNAAWETAIKELAQSLTVYLEALLETFWNTDMSHGQSRSAFFCECLRDTFQTRLLLQRQQATVTAQDFVKLMTVGLESGIEASLRVEKVRLSAPFKHYAILASTLMIGSKDTLGFLYTPSNGIKATSDLAAVKTTLLDLLKSEGDEDTLLNFMSLDERGAFLAMEPAERVISADPVNGPVFEQLLGDILDKQRSNLAHALTRYRASEGAQDAYALVDNALDVRGLIDDRLLVEKADGRWSTRADRRWSAQPATVRAESAKAQLARLATVEQALNGLIENHPAIPVTTRTVAEAQPLVDASIASLQASFTHTLSAALRSELNLRGVTRTLSAADQAIIKTVLDTPQRSQRAALNGFLPDVYALAVKADNAAANIDLASCFVVTERGGLDPKHSGRAILWTPARGFEAFNGLTPLLTELKRRLAHEDHRAILLENLGRNERSPARTYTLAPLIRIDDAFIDHVQKPYVQLDKILVASALATPLSAAPHADLLKWVALREPHTGLRRATDIAQSLTTQQQLPAWLATAPVKEQVLHCELLQQYLNHVEADEDYLSGIRSLSRTAHQQLQAQLKADTYELDPDKVQVNIIERSRSAARSQTLTEFALIHHSDLDQTHFQLTSLDSHKIPTDMDQVYIRNLIRNLNLSEHHQRALDTAFAATEPKAAERRQRFYAQLPWQLMHHAHAEKLQGRLSENGFDLVRQVLDMPDATARSMVEGAHAIIRPLEFAGVTNAETIKVPGVYLIGSSTDSKAPQILFAPYSPRHALKEYEDETQLLNELKSAGGLLDWVLLHITQPDRTSLEYRLKHTDKRIARATEAPVGTVTTAVTLASKPIKGGLFEHLLKDNLDLLGRLLGCQSDDQHRDGWEAVKHVLGEDIQAAFSFLTGKLAYPLAVWRSYRDIKQSAEDLQTHKWGAAIKAFISGIAQLATVRHSLDPETVTSAASTATATETASTRLKWKDVDVTAPERSRLKLHERVDIDLSAQTLDTQLGLYSNAAKTQHYGAIEGKVFAVAKRGSRWRISDGKTHGPLLRQLKSKQWTLDRDTPKPRFNLSNRLSTFLTVWEDMNVDAHGMSNIRLLFPQRARQIEQGLDQATTYVWNAFRNLQLLKTPAVIDTPIHKLIKDLLGVTAVLPVHVEKIEKVVGDIFAAMLDKTLRRTTSKRFVVGRLIHGAENTYAFTIPKDLRQRIYLAERFFNPGFDHYRPHLTDSTFPLNAHSRAATLIHEISHLACQTEDIAYLDTGKPFVELISEASTTAGDLKSALNTLQETALSIKTPYTELFKILDPITGTWDDVGSTDEDTKVVKQHLLKLTGADNLAGARDTFKKNPLIRLAVQLSNADSVTWLITHLGRQLHTTVP